MTDDPTTRIPAVDDQTRPIRRPDIPPFLDDALTDQDTVQLHPVQPVASDFLRIVAATTSLGVLVATGGVWVTGSWWWLLAAFPGGIVAALGLAAAVRRWAR
ncbi:hypothetical protein GCM10023403_10400 [Pseudonocardia benzenivorans]